MIRVIIIIAQFQACQAYVQLRIITFLSGEHAIQTQAAASSPTSMGSTNNIATAVIPRPRVLPMPPPVVSSYPNQNQDITMPVVTTDKDRERFDRAVQLETFTVH